MFGMADSFTPVPVRPSEPVLTLREKGEGATSKVRGFLRRRRGGLVLVLPEGASSPRPSPSPSTSPSPGDADGLGIEAREAVRLRESRRERVGDGSPDWGEIVDTCPTGDAGWSDRMARVCETAVAAVSGDEVDGADVDDDGVVIADCWLQSETEGLRVRWKTG